MSGQVIGSVSLSGGINDSAGEVVDAGVVGVEVVRAVVVKEDLAQRRVGQDLSLFPEQRDRGVRMSGKHEDPQVVLKRHPSLGEPQAGQLLEVAPDVGR